MNVKKKSTKFDSLQGIRAFAAIAVMLFHGTEMLSDKIGYLFMHHFSIAGFSGVDVFFVLSGFIIFHTSNTGKSNIHDFMKRRFIRIYPVYWLVTILLIISHLISPSIDQSYKIDLSIVLGSFLLFPQNQYVLGVAWTLTYEVIFYLVFALTYFRKPSFLLYTFAIWITIILGSYFLNFSSGFFAIDMLTKPIIINFAFGCLVAYFYQRFQHNEHLVWFFWCGVILFISTWSIFYQKKIVEPMSFSNEMARVYLFGLPASFLIFGALYLSNRVPRILVYLGDASYSLYLTHGTVLSILIKIILKLEKETLFQNFIGAFSLFVSTLIICCCFYSLVEKKLLGLLNYLFIIPGKQKETGKKT